MFDLLIVVFIFILSFLSGMLGLGVAFFAISILGLFGLAVYRIYLLL